MTLIELMVAVALSLLVVGLGIFAMMGASVSLRNVSGTTSTTDSSMLLTTVMQRAVNQAGFQPAEQAKRKFTREAYYEAYPSGYPGKPYPDIFGFSNYKFNGMPTDPTAGDFQKFYTSVTSGGLPIVAGGNNDVLALRFQAVPERLDEAGGITAMVDLCSGNMLATNPYFNYGNDDLVAEIYKPLFVFSVAPGGMDAPDAKGDVLFCDAYIEAAADETGVRGSLRQRTAIMDGIVAFKVLYGVPDAGASVWKDASAMVPADWYKVKRVRIGFILQSTVDNAGGIAKNGETVTLYPLGEQFSDKSAVTKTYEESVVYRVVNFTVDVNNGLIPSNLDAI